MSSIKGHFDGTAIVLDEPASLAVGQQVRIVIDSTDLSDTREPSPTPRKSLAGFAKGMLQRSFTPHVDPTEAAMHGEPIDERDALHIDPLNAVPPDVVRQPGSGAGEIKMADDFDETPDEFKEYL